MKFTGACDKLREMVAQTIILLQTIAHISEREEVIKKGVRACNLLLWKLYRAQKKAKKVSDKKHLTTCICNVKSYRKRLQNTKKTGGGLAGGESLTQRVRWEAVSSAFKTRYVKKFYS